MSAPPPAGIAHSPQVSTGMNVWGFTYGHFEFCVGGVVSGGSGIVVGLVHERCGMVSFIQVCTFDH